MEGVQNHVSNASFSTKSIRVSAMVNNLQRIRMICQQMPCAVRLSFKKKYGCLLDLLPIQVEVPVLSALTQFWNTKIRCFELPGLDLMPTIEEYETMMRVPPKGNDGVYLYRDNRVGIRKIAKLIGLQVNQTEAETKTWERTLLENHLESQANSGNWDNFNKTLALLIYGLVLFPFHVDKIEEEAMDVFFQYETQGVNPVPAILADTILSVEICCQKDGGTLRCCAQLLYVWIMTHLYAANHIGRMSDPLKGFRHIPVKKQEAREWKGEFARYDATYFPWVCPWYTPRETIFSCGDFPNVPLMGSRGCVTYTPAIALRQLKWTQVVPKDEELVGWYFLYNKEGTNGLQTEIRAAWKKVQRKGENELGKPRATASVEYKNWRRARGIHYEESSQKEGPSQTITPEMAILMSQLEVAKAQLALMEEKEEQAQIEKEILERQCQKKDMEINSLKDKCADLYESSTKKAKKGKEEEVDTITPELKNLQDQVEEMVRKIALMLEEKEQQLANIQQQEQRMEIMQEQLMVKHNEAGQWEELAKGHLESLTKANQQEENLAKTIRRLIVERGELKTEIERLKREKRDFVNEWETIIEYHQGKENEWRKRCEDMTDCVGEKVGELSRHLKGAMEELLVDQLPLKTYRLLRYCENLTRSLEQ